MPRAGAFADRPDRDFVDGEIAAPQPLGEAVVGARRPHRQHPAAAQRRAGVGQAAAVVELVVGGARQTLGAIVDVE